MPYSSVWVDPQVYLVHNGVVVYHTYKDDDLEQGPRAYGFSLNPLCGDEYCCDCPDPGSCRNVFDVRELPNWVKPNYPPFHDGENDNPENRAKWRKYREDRVEDEERHIQSTIRNALDQGILVAPRRAEDQATPGSSKTVPPGFRAQKADCLVLAAPDWFKRPDFITWRSHPHVAKWVWADEGKDTFLVYDEGDLSEDGFLPKDIAQGIHQEAERAGMKYGTVWIKSV